MFENARCSKTSGHFLLLKLVQISTPFYHQDALINTVLQPNVLKSKEVLMLTTFGDKQESLYVFWKNKYIYVFGPG